MRVLFNLVKRLFADVNVKHGIHYFNESILYQLMFNFVRQKNQADE